MLLEPPSDAVLCNTFDRVLFGILSGSLPAAPECSGLDERTRVAEFACRPAPAQQRVQDPLCQSRIRPPA